jgi:UrcA family protein
MLGAALSAGGLGIIAGAPASAQSTVEELTVTGHYGPDNTPSRLSQAVSYADLDLSTSDGRYLLKQRISLTARYLCDRLGEDEASDGVLPSCKDAAISDAMAQARPIIPYFTRGSQWAAGPAWNQTYPDSPYP